MELHHGMILARWSSGLAISSYVSKKESFTPMGSTLTKIEAMNGDFPKTRFEVLPLIRLSFNSESFFICLSNSIRRTSSFPLEMEVKAMQCLLELARGLDKSLVVEGFLLEMGLQ